MKLQTVNLWCKYSLCNLLCLYSLCACTSLSWLPLEEEEIVAYFHEDPDFVFSFHTTDTDILQELLSPRAISLPPEAMSYVKRILGSVKDAQLIMIIEHHIPLGPLRRNLKRIAAHNAQHHNMWEAQDGSFSLELLNRTSMRISFPPEVPPLASHDSSLEYMNLFSDEALFYALIFDIPQRFPIAIQHIELLCYADRHLEARIAPEETEALRFLLTSLRLAKRIPLIFKDIELPIRNVSRDGAQILIETEVLSKTAYMDIFKEFTAAIPR